jgi:rubrerythrin
LTNQLNFNKQQMTRFIPALLMALLYLMPTSPIVEARQLKDADARALVVIKGRALCLDESGNKTAALFGCDERVNNFGLIDKDAKLHSFDPADSSTAVFTDARVRARELQVTARLNAKNRLEIIKVQSVREGKLYDIYYFCEICNIRAYVPGPCPCCQKELEFKETPP